MLFSNFEERNWYYPGNYETIIDDRNPANVDTVSMLRHYCNCHGVTKELREYLNMSKDKINKIRDYCAGQIPISELKKDPERFINEGIEKQKRIDEAYEKNRQLGEQLEEARENFCGLGTKRIKFFLNKLSKQGDINAMVLRQLLEIEDKNISAKKTWYHPEWLYYKKSELIKNCARIYGENKMIYGVQRSDNHSANTVMYFELPVTGEQVSFHTNMDGEEYSKYLEYPKKWDEQVNSTIPKLEKCLMYIYGEEIRKIQEEKAENSHE